MRTPRRVPINLSDHFTYPRLFRFVLPSIVMMVFTSIYGVVDGFFVSNFVGTEPFAAINLIMPFVMILGGMGFMIGTGGTALVSKIMGEGDDLRAKRTFSMMIRLTVILGGILTALGLIFMEPVARLLGADANTFGDCVRYGRIVVAFTVMYMLQSVFQSFLIAAEKPKLGLAVTVAAGVTNMVLDALFIAVFQWGVAGAAIATGISQCVGGIIPLIYFSCPNKSRLRMTRTRLSLHPILQACGNGSSELMSNISSSLVSMLYNHQLLKYFNGNDGVAAYGVLMYVQFIFVAIYVGYAVGVAPVVSYAYGASRRDEMKNLLKKSMWIMGVAGVVLTAAAIGLAVPLAHMFVSSSPSVYELTVGAFRMFAASFLLAGFNIFLSSFFTALNNGVVSAAISFLRTLIFQTAAVILLPILIGPDGVWWAVAAAEVVAFVISISFLFGMRKKYHLYVTYTEGRCPRSWNRIAILP